MLYSALSVGHKNTRGGCHSHRAAAATPPLWLKTRKALEGSSQVTRIWGSDSTNVTLGITELATLIPDNEMQTQFLTKFTHRPSTSLTRATVWGQHSVSCAGGHTNGVHHPLEHRPAWEAL